MDPASEALMRSAFHDLANTLSGIRGILEMSNPDVPLSARDQARLDAILTEGMLVIERSRHLGLGTFPEFIMESGMDWRSHLQQRMKPMGTLFRRQFEILYEGEQVFDRWPGALLREFVHAVTRQVLPFSPGGTLLIYCRADAKHWSLFWPQAMDIPEALTASVDSLPRDISAKWARSIARELGIVFSLPSEGLCAKLARF